MDQKEENVQKLSALAGQFKEQSEELWEQYRNKAEQIFGDAGAESLPEVKRRLSEAINNCDQKLKDAQKAAESLKNARKRKRHWRPMRRFFRINCCRPEISIQRQKGRWIC